MVDMVVHRHELRPTIARICRMLTGAPAWAPTVDETAPGSPSEPANAGAA